MRSRFKKNPAGSSPWEGGLGEPGRLLTSKRLPRTGLRPQPPAQPDSLAHVLPSPLPLEVGLLPEVMGNPLRTLARPAFCGALPLPYGDPCQLTCKEQNPEVASLRADSFSSWALMFSSVKWGETQTCRHVGIR